MFHCRAPADGECLALHPTGASHGRSAEIPIEDGQGGMTEATSLAAPSSPALHGAPPWIFGVMIAPMGVFNGVLTIVFPYLAAHRGMPVAAIGSVVGAGMLASPLKLLWTPLIDLAWPL